MKISFKITSGKMDTTALQRLSGIAQGEIIASLKRTVAKNRLQGFRLEYDGLTVTFPAKDGEQTIEV